MKMAAPSEKLESMREHCRRHSKAYSPAHCAKGFLDLFRDHHIHIRLGDA